MLIVNFLSTRSFLTRNLTISLEQSEKTKGSSAVLVAFSTLQCLHDAPLGEIQLSGREEQHLTDQVHICIWLSINTNVYRVWLCIILTSLDEGVIPLYLYMHLLCYYVTMHMDMCILESWTVGDYLLLTIIDLSHVLPTSLLLYKQFQNLIL